MGGDSLEPFQAISNLKISKVSSIEKIQNTFLLHKYYHFPKKLLVDEKQVQPGLILSFSYFSLAAFSLLRFMLSLPKLRRKKKTPNNLESSFNLNYSLMFLMVYYNHTNVSWGPFGSY